jgi:hypothetical protein
MRHTSVVDSGAGADVSRARQGLACGARAGLARPPIPQGGLGWRLSILGGSLAPPAATLGGTARPMALPRHVGPGAAVDDGRVAHSIDRICISRAVGGAGGGAALAPPQHD